MHQVNEPQKIQLPKVGQFVRVKKHHTYKNPSDVREIRRYEVILAEGLVTSTLFDENFEVSYVLDERPMSHWFSVTDISSVEIL